MTQRVKIILTSLLLTMIISCKDKNNDQESNKYKTEGQQEDLWLSYSKEATLFKLWSPFADQVKLRFYENGDKGEAFETYDMHMAQGGAIWEKKIKKDLNGVYYTYQVKFDNEWLEETPGIYAKAVGVNGKRAMVLDFESTNPPNWKQDKGPELKYPNEAIIYELHIRDMTIHPQSGSTMPGTYLGLVEEGTKGLGWYYNRL